MERLFGICDLALVPLRAEASDRSEMVSQLLFGDHFEILSRTEKWIQICTAYDDYKGWIDHLQYKQISQRDYEELNQGLFCTGLFNDLQVVKQNSEVLNLVPGCSIPFYSNKSFHINDVEYTAKKVVSPSNCFLEEIEQAAKFYLNAPYLWGGKSPYGIDCSGFTQIVFKQFNIRIKRDASQQVLQGEVVGSLQEANVGDLAFFDNNEGRITHVGILLNNHQIIHASGYVKINKIDDHGIYNEELKRYTHTLRIIKRYA
ncbi:MAG: hypothetical protein JWN56_907 [Sphingobacteriales bacterium]|nr:hypothetical protein [Sphingobacteriales bacterium]